MKNIKLKYFLIFILIILIVHLLVKLYFKNFSKEDFFQQQTISSTLSHLNRPVGAILYENSPNGIGWQARITEGNWNYHEFTNTFGGNNDKASWIRVNQGYKAILYEHGDFTGISREFSAGDYNLADSESEFPNNQASSIKVLSERNDQIGAVLYQHSDNIGWAARFPLGEYNSQAFVNQGAIIDDASSIIINNGYKATLYTGNNFDGEAVEYTQSSNSFGSNNDNFKSIKVEFLSSFSPTTSVATRPTSLLSQTTSATADRYLSCNNNQYTANYNEISQATQNGAQVPNSICLDKCNDNQYLSNFDEVVQALSSTQQVPNFNCLNISNCNDNQYVSRVAERITSNDIPEGILNTNIGRYKSNITCSDLSTCNATYPSNRDAEAEMCRQYITRTHQVGSKDNVGSNREFRDFTEPRICNDPTEGVYPLEYLDSLPNSVNGFYYRDKTYTPFTDINRCSEENIYNPNNPN